MLTRRALLASASALSSSGALAAVAFPAVTRTPLRFPRDHGAHPDFRIEWWYLTGWLDAPGKPSIGFQVTFFRSRTDIDSSNPSAFTARQLLIAHAAFADPDRGALIHDERLMREGFGVASAATTDTDVRIDRWRFWRRADGSYEAAIPARGFTLEFQARPTQPVWLQGEAGFSRKGPLEDQASFYYSQPQLSVRARLTRADRTEERTGSGWLDHEWSSTPLSPDAAGWDWLGMNLDDGGALIAFQIRAKNSVADAAPMWSYAALRRADQTMTTFASSDVRARGVSTWVSPRTRATWPVSQQWQIGSQRYNTVPLMDDQELDSRATAGTVYWEGASRLVRGDRQVGRGYLEMTGYVAPIRL